ncbi:MAG: ROK family protein [Candidatus Bipolaricaulia bacterium]
MQQLFDELRLEKRINLKKILNLIRDMDGISRIEISRMLGISPSSVSQSVNQLIQLGMVTETGVRESDRGRKPTLLQFNPDVKYILGIDMEKEEIRVALLNLDADIKQWFVMPTFSEDEDPLLALEKVFRFVGAFLDDLGGQGISQADILSIAISVNGPVNYNTGIVYEAPHISWPELNLKEAFEQRFSWPVIVENNVNCIVLAEKRKGVAIEAQDIICLTIYEGHGAGASLILNGELYRGYLGEAGEIGWLYLKEQLPDEAYQMTGEFERRIARMTADLSSISSSSDDEVKRRVVAEIGQFIGINMANLINMFNPEMVILTGMPEAISELVILEIISVVKLLTPQGRSECVQFKIGALSEKEGALIGTGILASDLFFSFSDDVMLRSPVKEATS